MRKLFGWMVAPVLIAASVASAQERREPGAATRDPARPTGAVQPSRGDQEIAAIKLAHCRNEIELAKLATEKAQSPEVKQFAEKLVKDHTQACKDLEKWAGNLAGAPTGRVEPTTTNERRDPTTRPAPGTDATRPQPGTRPSTGTENQPGARPTPGADNQPGQRTPDNQPGARTGTETSAHTVSGGGLNWVAIHQDLAAQCLASAKQELSKKDSSEFDKCFMLMAIGGHQHAVDADHVFMKHASPQFRPEVEKCLKIVTSHLNEAKDIYKKVEAASPRLTRNPN